MRPNQIRRLKEKQRMRARRAWDKGLMQAHINQRDRSEDNAIRAKLDRKGQLVFAATLPDGTKLRVEWSRHGRTDQWDIVDADGVVAFTGRPALVAKELESISTSAALHTGHEKNTRIL